MRTARTRATSRADGIDLRYGGGRIDDEVRRVVIADSTYDRLVSIDGVATP